MKHFDFCIGNPPYQEDTKNEGDRPNPIYDKFMDAAFEVADCIELIHPARFLFNAGQTSKAWNEKMLHDEHFKVLSYEPDAANVFPSTDIKGGVAITLRDNSQTFGSIGTFTSHTELNSIVKKVVQYSKEAQYLDTFISSRGMYRLSSAFYAKYPYAAEKVGKGSGNMIVSNIFDKLPEAFLITQPTEPGSYIKIYGRTNNKRTYRYLRSEYVIANDYIDKYKLFFPEANSSGQFGETLTLPDIGYPGEGATDTFINIGPLASLEEATSLLKYIKTKFLRTMLGTKKATQHTPKSVWELVPLQDFTPASDIDWSKSIPEIDRQLYAKYGLTDEEIEFIETHVKEMV